MPGWEDEAVRIRDGLEIDDERLAEICERYGVEELWLFGSALRDDFHDQSDVDLLYVFKPDAHIGWKIVDLHEELEAVFGRKVDLVSKRWINEHMRQEVLASARLLRVAA